MKFFVYEEKDRNFRRFFFVCYDDEDEVPDLGYLLLFMEAYEQSLNRELVYYVDHGAPYIKNIPAFSCN